MILTSDEQQHSNPIFVIGAGRSGTHLIGYTISAHPDVRGTIETKPMFQWSTAIALNPDHEQDILPKLILTYRQEIDKSFPKRYMDKSHPNIWIAEKLLTVFPNAKFVGIERNPFATVASMFKNKGVVALLDRYQDFPIPNRFLGIDHNTREEYDKSSSSARYAHTWIAHHVEMNRLQKVIGSNLFVLKYEFLIHDCEQILVNLQAFLELSTPIPKPEICEDTLYKWCNELSDKDIKEIRNVVGMMPDEWIR